MAQVISPNLQGMAPIAIWNGATWNPWDGTLQDSAHMAIYNVNTMTWGAWDGSLTVGSVVIGKVDQATGQGRNLLFGPIAQGAPGTTQLAAGDPTKKLKMVSYAFVISAAGTVKFADAAGDLTGAFPVVANAGVVAVGQPSSHLFETGVNKALSIVTTGGAASGHFSYFLEA